MSNILTNESKISKIINALNNNINNNNNDFINKNSNGNNNNNNNNNKKLNVFTLIIEPNFFSIADENNNNTKNIPCDQIQIPLPPPPLPCLPEPVILIENDSPLVSQQNSNCESIALEDQQRLTKDLEERRAKAEQDRIQLEKERIEAEKKASQIADIANEEKERMVSVFILSFYGQIFVLYEKKRKEKFICY